MILWNINAVGIVLLAVQSALLAVGFFRYAFDSRNSYRDVYAALGVSCLGLCGMFGFGGSVLLSGRLPMIAYPMIFAVFVWLANLGAMFGLVVFASRYHGMVAWNVGRALMIRQIETMPDDRARVEAALQSVSEIRNRLWESLKRLDREETGA